MKNSADPSFSQEFKDMPNWDRSFWLSRAFIEASRCLCTSMLADDFSSQYSSSRVILHLARHGIELFLKAAIWASADQPTRPNHNLEELFLEYRRIYPDSSFLFEIPSRFKVDLNMDLFPETMKLFHSTLDQRHRYPAGRDGEDFATPEIFDPEVVLKEILALDKSLKVLEFCKIRTLVSDS